VPLACMLLSLFITFDKKSIMQSQNNDLI
jgi:hypothetical protein